MIWLIALSIGGGLVLMFLCVATVAALILSSRISASEEHWMDRQ